ncbi:hypothetical protein [Microvirga rosea]|uniref:hypothetical protein n=1 Tax=Microvirga rosea TaxID=2715425 RepID=UPI001D0B2F56|nr:hypothetical protein [Microvirga rosea]MCB8822292.1 hypothetical protein [Microvirga rosea]
MNVHGRNWTLEDTHALVSLAKEGMPVSVISLKLKRSLADVLTKLNELGLAPPVEA